MQALILAAGKGKRLDGLIGDKPKCFLEINGKRILDYQLDFLNENGIKDILIVVGYNKDLIIKEYSNKGIRFIENPFYGITNVLSSFWFGAEYLSDDFIYLHADTIFHKKILELLLKAKGHICLPIDKKNEYADEDMKVRIINNTIVEINKTMPNSIANGEFIGIAKIKKTVLSDLKRVTEEIIYREQYSSFFEVALQELINYGKNITPLEIGDLPWNEIDFKEDYYQIIKTNFFK